MKSHFSEQKEYLESNGIAIGDHVDVVMPYFRSETTSFKAVVVVAVENPEQYKIGKSCHFSDMPIRLKATSNCSKNWIKKGHLVAIHNIELIKKCETE